MFSAGLFLHVVPTIKPHTDMTCSTEDDKIQLRHKFGQSVYLDVQGSTVGAVPDNNDGYQRAARLSSNATAEMWAEEARIRRELRKRRAKKRKAHSKSGSS